MQVKRRMPIYYLSLCALFAALSAVLSQIAIPIGPVPINMVHVSVFCAAGLLGAKYGTLSQVVFVIMGTVGIPVFAQFNAGLWRITAGYIIGNVFCTLVAALIIDKFGRSVKVLVSAMCAGFVMTYLFGITWVVFWTNHLSPYPPEVPLTAAAAIISILLFLPGDALKVIMSVVLIRRLHPVMQRRVHR